MHDSYSPRQRRRTHLDVDHCAVHVQTTTGDNDHDDYDAIALLAQQESPEKSKRRRTMQTLPLTLRLLVQRITGNKPTSIGVLMAAVALFVVSQLDLFAATPVNTTATTTHYRSWSFASSWTTALHSPTVGPPVAFSPRVARRLDTSLLRPDATKPLREPMLTDLGGLDLMTLHHTALKFCRVIDPRDATILQAERSALFEDIDDDEVNEHYDHTDEVTGQKECVRNNWGHRPRPVCNHFHESTVSFESSASQVQRYDINYLSHGYYRDSWLYKSKDQLAATTTTADTQDDDFFIFKTLRMHEDHEFNYYSLRKVEKEALVMEALSASHLIVDIYGHCATSIIAEAMPGEITTAIVPGDVDDYDRGHVKQSDLDALQQDDVYPLNNLTVTEKLDYALLMAEAVAELHGYEGGVIVHGDLHPDQYLKAADGRIKLNDFNNGHLLLYSVENQTYCRFSSSYGGGYKAPEEFTGDYSNESVDTWAIGHGIFGLLTGLYPYYRTFSHSTIRKMVIEGRKPFVDDRYRNRSMVESRLVEIMEHCWEYEPDDRPEIFDVVEHIRETKKMYEDELATGGGKERSRNANGTGQKVHRDQVKRELEQGADENSKGLFGGRHASKASTDSTAGIAKPEYRGGPKVFTRQDLQDKFGIQKDQILAGSGIARKSLTKKELDEKLAPYRNVSNEETLPAIPGLS